MDIRNLKFFIHLCDSLHFSRSAEQLHVSPSTLSRSMQRLEAEVGQCLFERDNRQVLLTDAGQEFKQFAEQTLLEWQNLKYRLEPNTEYLKGKLRLYCSVTAAYSHLPKLLDTLRQQHPNVEIILTTGDAANAVDEVMQNKADIAIAALPQSFPEKLYFAPIDNIALKVVSPAVICATSELLEQAIIPWEQLPLIVPDHGPGRQRTDKWLKDMKIKGNIYAQVSGYEAMTSMVALGCGISILPDAVLNNSPVRDRIKEIDSPVAIAPFELGCCCKKRRSKEAIIAAFLNVIN